MNEHYQHPEYVGGDHGRRVLSIDHLRGLGIEPSEHVQFVKTARGSWRAVEASRRIGSQASSAALEAALKPFLDDLTIPQRDALRLVYWERMTLRAAADRLGIALTSLVDRLDAAAKALKAAFEAAGLGTEYRDVRQRLTPLEDLAKFHTARCVDCGTPVAQYRPNALGLLPALLCPDHGTAR